MPALSSSFLNADKLFTLRLIISLFLVLIACVLVFFIPVKSSLFNYSVLLGATTIIFNGIFNSANLIFQKRLRYDLSVVASSSGAFATFGIIYYLSSKEVAIPYLMLASTLGWMINNIVISILLKKIYSFRIVALDLNYLKDIFFNIWPISLTLLLNVLYFKLDSFILGSIYPIAVVGEYNLAYQFFQTALVLPTFIMNSYYPLMLRNLEQSKAVFFKQIKIGSLILLGISIVGTIITLFTAPFFINLLSGEETTIVSLKILSTGFPAFFVSALLMWALISLKKYKTILFVYSFGISLNLILNIILIPKYSYLAASWVTVFCEHLILLLLIFILYKQSKFK